MQTQREEKGEEASLASQEHVQIRGNDARHLLIQKLMRTNRSSVVLLKNMVEPKDVDEFLEDEIKEECQKYGTVTDVSIVSFKNIYHRGQQESEGDTSILASEICPWIRPRRIGVIRVGVSFDILINISC